MAHEVHSKKNESTKDAFPPKITTACDHSIPCPKRSENYVHCDPQPPIIPNIHSQKRTTYIWPNKALNYKLLKMIKIS